MTVCKFWKSGNCRSGNNCRFEHPSDNGNTGRQGGGFGGDAVFGALSRPERWQMNEDDIKNDLTNTLPKWILSAYGPGKEPPYSLFMDNEYSQEEIRWRFYQAQALSSADAEAADREAVQVWAKAQNDIRNASTKTRDIQPFMLQKEKEHPNRYDFTKMTGTISADEHGKNSHLNTIPGTSVNPFGAAQRDTPSSNPFARPAFGDVGKAPAFGQPAQPSAFGQPAQPSAFGQPAQPSAFGKPAFGETGFASKSPFGQQQAQAPAFGQTGFASKSPFGAQGQQSPFGGKPLDTTSGFAKASPFGQAASNSAFSQPTTAPGFGQPSAIGQQSSNNPFGKPTAATGFGQASTGPQLAPAFGQSGFGATGFGSPAPATGQGVFGQNRPAAAPSQNPFSAISQPSQQAPTGPSSNPFSTVSQTAQQTQPSPFGQAQPSTAFGQPSQPQSTFGQPSQPQSTFGQPSQPNPSPFGQAAQSTTTSPFGQTKTSTTLNGQALQSTSATAFGQGQGIPSASPFGQNAQPAQSMSSTAFGKASNMGQGSAGTGAPEAVLQPSSSKPTDKPIHPLHYTQSLPQHQTQFDASGKLTTYRSQPVAYDIKMRPDATGHEVLDSENPIYQRPDGRGAERIWFPRGAIEAAVQKLPSITSDLQLAEVKYTDEVKEQYAKLFETGKFERGTVPLVPPMHGWVDYDF